MQRITQERMRDMNRRMIYMYIYKGGEVKQQNIAHDLKMSRPTVRGHLSAMKEEGLIVRKISHEERCSSGRRPVVWSAEKDYKIAVGVEILKHEVKIIAINLYGDTLKCEKLQVSYENSEKYYEFISSSIKDFIASLGLKNADSKILGIGFALQGLISEDGSTVIYGEILKYTGLKIDVFTKRLNYPCRFIHEPDGAALSELWVSPELQDAIYLSMSEHFGGAFIAGRKILSGQHRHSATFEHITANPDGEPCYCGKIGCFETIFSKSALLRDEDPDKFFSRVRSGETEAVNRWRVLLKYLGRLIAHLHFVYDTKYILGGHLAPYFNQEDINVLYDYVRERTPFVEDDDYILQSKMPSNNITIGAALPYIMSFLENVCC